MTSLTGLRARLCAFALIPFSVFAADSPGIITGKVTLAATGDPMHHATVRLVQLRLATQTADDGSYRFQNVPPGTYTMLTHMHAFTDDAKTVTVKAGQTALVDFQLKIAVVKQEVTVTSSGAEETSLETFQSVTSKEALDLTQSPATSLGDLIDGEAGVSKRTSGPGTSRPVVRGFDGDRVLILQDGVRSGTVSSQSGDHGEPVDSNSIDQVEVVRGPATLLYGSNAIGGVVNMISSHHQMHEHPHEGARGYLTGTAGTADRRGGAAGGVEIGRKDWLFWADGGGQRSGDFASPAGIVTNSFANIKNASFGLARYGEKVYFAGGYGVYDGDYGIPYDTREIDPEKVSIAYRRQNARFTLGIKDVGTLFDQIQFVTNYTDWNHKERGPGEVNPNTIVTHNEFFNRQFVYRGSFEQKKRGRWSGTLGFWGMRRDYKAVGDEAITPPTVQNGFAVFALEQAQFRHFRLQFGGRLETNAYAPDGLRDRRFTGFSGSTGINVPLWKGGAFVANYTHSYRAPALEELYALGPHAGNQTWEIGDANMKRERGEGIDVSLRQQSGRTSAELNMFYYGLRDFVYLAPTGAIDNGLIVARYSQADSRYWGMEGRWTERAASNLWLKFGLDTVQAELTNGPVPLPRIPPVRGRAGIEWRWHNLSLQPELVATNRQSRVFTTETETPGFVTFGAKASYTITKQHSLQMFSVNLYNAGDRLYRNHLSFIKDFAPEIGRGVLVSYTIRFF